MTFYTSANLAGDNGWTYVELTLNSGNNTSIYIQCTLGGFFNTCTGTAWFDDLVLEKIN